MNLQLLTKDDLKPIEALQHQMVKILDKLVDKKPTKVLRVVEIRKRLGLSPVSFQARIPEMTSFGLFKDGQYSMTEEDLERYIAHLKVKHLPNN